MANLAVKDGIWLVRFRFAGKEFKRSLQTREPTAAQAAQHAVEWTIHRLSSGQLQLPPSWSGVLPELLEVRLADVGL